MPVIQNTYRKLDRDTSFNKVDKESYFDARNLRSVSNDPSKSGALSSAKGNLDLLGNWSNLGYSSDIIIGSKRIRDFMLLITTDDDSLDPISANSDGRLWRAPFKNDSIVMADLVLLYNGKLNLSAQYPIEDIIGFYENDDIIKVYWTDHFNYFRFCNLADPDLSSRDPEEFNIVQAMDMPIPTYEKITSGDIPVGVIQYAYRYYKLNGPSSNFSTCSQIIPLADISLIMNNTKTFKGSDRLNADGTPKSSGKGIMMKITGADLNYDRIEIVAIHYAALNEEPVIYIVDVMSISSTMYINDSGNYDLGTYTLSEFNMINNPFICKTLSPKNNILFAGNVNQNEFDFSFDARAYRWKANFVNPSCNLYEKDGSYWNNVYGGPVTQRWLHYNAAGTVVLQTIETGMANLPVDIDAICHSNDISWDKANSQYIYQKDMSTIGGEGPNVKYEFKETDEGGAPYPYQERHIDNSVEDSSYSIPHTGYPYKNSYYGGAESPKYNFQIRSWCRDEIYRCGLIGIDNKGRISPVKWIGDIRTPNNKSVPFIASTSPSTPGNLHSMPIMIEFTIDNLPVEVKYVQIVYVKRLESDKTVIFQGKIEMTQGTYGVSEDMMPPHMSSVLGYGAFGNPFPKHIIMFSPELSFNKDFTQGSDDYVEIIGTMDGVTVTHGTTGSGGHLPQIVSTKYYNYAAQSNRWSAVTNATLRRTTLTPDEEQQQETFGDITHFRPVMHYNASGTNSYGNLGTCVLIQLSTNLPTAGISGIGNPHLIANYRSNKYGIQYGGNSYEDRTRNIYIAASAIGVVSAGSVVINAKNGDTFIGMSDLLVAYYNDYYATHSSVYGLSGGSTTGWVNMIPCESTINLAYTIDDCWHRIYTFGNDAIYGIREIGNKEFTAWGVDYVPNWSDMYIENTVYRRLADAKKFYPAPLDYKAEYLNDTLVMASNMKEGRETIDPWTQWLTNETIILEKNWGALNKLISWRDKLIYWQDDAVGVLSVLDRAVVTDSENRNISLGEGTVLQRYDNIATNMGLSTRFSITESPNGIYWYDHKRKQLNRFLNNIEDLSTIRGVNSYLNTIPNNYSDYDNIVSPSKAKGFFMIYNPIYKEIFLITKSAYNSVGSGDILVYSEVEDCFKPFLDTRGYYFMNFDNKLFSAFGQYIYKEDLGNPGEFHGGFYDSYVTVIVNPVPNMTSTFTNFEITSEVYQSSGVQLHTRTIDTIRQSNDYQDTGDITISSSNTRRLLRTWKVDGGRNLYDNARIRDTYSKVTLRFKNDSNNQSIVLHDLISLYMVPAESIANKMIQK
jgi:hypothetical protein